VPARAPGNRARHRGLHGCPRPSLPANLPSSESKVGELAALLAVTAEPPGSFWRGIVQSTGAAWYAHRSRWIAAVSGIGCAAILLFTLTNRRPSRRMVWSESAGIPELQFHHISRTEHPARRPLLPSPAGAGTRRNRDARVPRFHLQAYSNRPASIGTIRSAPTLLPDGAPRRAPTTKP
jgi:hypothetical protein